MRKLIEGLRHFQEHVLWEKRELFARSVEGQKPQALLITCSDSRVLPETLMQAGPGDLFVSRNAGNLVPPPDFVSGEAATIEYAVGTLAIRDIIVCGHYRCGAIRAMLEPSGNSDLLKTEQWLTHAAAGIAKVKRDHPELKEESLWDKAVEQNVLEQLKHLSQHPVIANGLVDRTIRLHAWVLRFESGEVYRYDLEQDDFVPLKEDFAEMAAVTSELTSSQIQLADSADKTDSWLGKFKADALASLVVFATALPLCVAIAKACGTNTSAGIIAAIIGGIVVGTLGGGVFQISGPTAGLIAIVYGIIDQKGALALATIVLLAGMIQIGGSILRMGQWFRAVSPAVVLGMLSGIGITLCAQQFHVTLDDTPARSTLTNLVGIPQAFVDIFNGHDGHETHIDAALIGALTLLALLFWKPFVPTRLKAIPGVLVAVGLASALTSLFNLPIQKVAFDGLAAGFNPISFSSVYDLLSDSYAWQQALAIAFVASAETLLTASAIDQVHRGPRTRYDQELFAQGIGNTLCVKWTPKTGQFNKIDLTPVSRVLNWR